MAIRTITWTVDEKLRITPRRVQDAGVQGEDNATRVEFVLPAILQSGYTLYLEYLDNVNKPDKTDPLKVSDGKVAFDLPFEWTQHGGEAVVRLVAENDNVIDYTIDGRVRYADRSTALTKSKSLFEGSLQRAQAKIEKMIADAKVWIDNVKGIYVGSGPMPDGCVIQIDPEGEALLLDNEMSDESENVPKTKVVKAYADGGDVSTLSSAKAYADDVAKESAENVAKECVLYPGCFYRSSRYGGMEWLNPPMLPGVEYLTTERHNGEPVWVKLVELGSMPTFDETYGVDSDKDGNYERAVKSVEVIQNGEIHWFDAWVTTPTDKRIQQMPFHSSDGSILSKIDASAGNKFSLYTYTRGLTSYYAHAIVKFTRPNIAPATTEWERRMLERIDLAMLHTSALRDVPKCNDEVTGAFTIAGDTLTGINYSGVIKSRVNDGDNRSGRLVGMGVPLSTYYSAMENPTSVMYTAGDVLPDDKGVSSYYGVNCSGFVCYAMGWTLYRTTEEFATKLNASESDIYSYKGELLDIATVEDLRNVRRGDIVVNTVVNAEASGNHVKLVKDIFYDEEGDLIGFNIAESVRPYVRVVFMTPAEFLAQMSEDKPYSVIRVDDSEYKTATAEKIEYSKSVYPDKGDGGKYTVGDEVQLYIPDTGATAITVNGTTMALADLETTTVNDVTVYKLPIKVAGTYTIATNAAPEDPCTVIVKEAK